MWPHDKMNGQSGYFYPEQQRQLLTDVIWMETSYPQRTSGGLWLTIVTMERLDRRSEFGKTNIGVKQIYKIYARRPKMSVFFG